MSAASPPGSGALIRGVAQAFGTPIDPPTEARLLAFLQLLLHWNARINLTGARSLEELVQDHLPDSFALRGLLPPGVQLVDVGSGGGLPALPFALLRPDVRLTLVEPRAKRVAFLRTAVRELAIPAEVVAGRMESLTRRFEVAMARATFAPAEWLEKARPLVTPGGRVILLLSGRGEVPAGTTVAATVTYQADGKERVAVAVDV